MNKQILIALAGITLLAVTGFLIHSSTPTQNDQTAAIAAYQQWKRQYGIRAANPEEDLYRQSIFVENYLTIEEHNANPEETYKMGLNLFSNLTEEEFKSIYLMTDVVPETPKNTFVPNLKAPRASSINWANENVLPPVKDQGQCGSCWAFSTVGLLESTNVIFNKVPVVSFSEQQLVDCSTAYNNYGCNGGMPSSAVKYVVANGGITTEAQYPYTAVDGTCNTNVTLAFNPSPSVAVPNNVSAFQAALNIQPVSICVDASKWSSYKSGVFHKCSSSPSKLDHAVVLVGYESNGDWIVRNSWGTSWGNAGYITLKKGNTCGVLNYGIVTGV